MSENNERKVSPLLPPVDDERVLLETGRPRRVLLTLHDDRALSEIAGILSLDDEHLREIDPARELPFPELTFVAIDTETTGLDPETDEVLELAFVRFEGGVEVARQSAVCRVPLPLDAKVRELTGIEDEEVRGAGTFAEVLPAALALLDGADFIAAYNAPFDRAFLERCAERHSVHFPRLPWVDVLVLIRELDRYKPGKNLGQAARRWGVSPEGAHRALPDARAAGDLLMKLAPYLPSRSLSELLEHQGRWVGR